jgi:hypothetical protein
MDSFNILNEQKEKYSGVFEGIFGNKSKKENDNEIIKEINGIYYLNGNKIKQLNASPGIYPYTDEIWKNEKYSWILSCKFEAEKIFLNDKGLSFNGIWEDGIFRGAIFWGEKSEFKKGEFRGISYEAPSKSYKESPENFFGKKFIDSTYGLLGKEKIKENITIINNGAIELIQIPVGAVVKLTDAKRQEFVFKLKKTLDNVDNIFVFENITNGGEIKMPWEIIRRDYQDKGFFGKNEKLKLFQLRGFGVLSKIELLLGEKNMVDFKTSTNQQKNVLETAKIRLSFKPVVEKIPQFNMYKSTLTIDPMDGENRAFVEKIQEKIDNGQIANLLFKIKQDIKAGIITGYGKYSFLHDIFDGEMGNDKLDGDTEKLMDYLNKMVRYVFYRILPLKNKNNKRIIDAKTALFKLKNYLNPDNKKEIKNNKNQKVVNKRNINKSLVS